MELTNDTNQQYENRRNVQKKKSLYEYLVLSGRVLKCTVTEAIELTNLDQLKDIVDQSGNLFLSNMQRIENLVKDKIIIKYLKVENKMYWSPCTIFDFFSVSGITYHQTGDIVFEGVDELDPSEKVSFYGRDIKKAFDNIVLTGEVDPENQEVLQNILQGMVDYYFKSKFSIRDTNLYFIAMIENKETLEMDIKLIRDLKNSPKPQNPQVVTNEEVKTVISLDK